MNNRNSTGKNFYIPTHTQINNYNINLPKNVNSNTQLKQMIQESHSQSNKSLNKFLRSLSPDQLAALKLQQLQQIVQKNKQNGGGSLTQRIENFTPIKIKDSIFKHKSPSLLESGGPQSSNQSNLNTRGQASNFIINAPTNLQNKDQQYSQQKQYKEEKDVLTYKLKIKTLKFENKKLIALLEQSENFIQDKVAETKKEYDQVQVYKKSFDKSLINLGLLKDQKTLGSFQNFKELTVALDLILTDSRTIDNSPKPANLANIHLPSIEQFINSSTHLNNINANASQEQVSIFRKENEELKMQVAKLENQLNHMQTQFKFFFEQSQKLVNEFQQLKAFRKSITQYFTSNQALNNSNGFALPDQQNSHSNEEAFALKKQYEEPYPSYLRIIMNESKLDDEVYQSQKNIEDDENRISPTKMISSPNFKNLNAQDMTNNASIMSSQNFSLPNLESQHPTMHRNSSFYNKKSVNNLTKDRSTTQFQDQQVHENSMVVSGDRRLIGNKSDMNLHQILEKQFQQRPSGRRDVQGLQRQQQQQSTGALMNRYLQQNQ